MACGMKKSGKSGKSSCGSGKMKAAKKK